MSLPLCLTGSIWRVGAALAVDFSEDGETVFFNEEVKERVWNVLLILKDIREDFSECT